MSNDLGLVHMNGRIYDGLLGRFLSADVTVSNPAYLQSYNRYSYVNNNPLTLTDPSGFIPITDEIRAVVAQEIQAAADIAELVHGPSNGNLDIANAQHKTFQNLMGKSKYADFIVTEQSISADGMAVKRQRYTDSSGNTVSRWPANSKRPDAMILADSDYKAGILEGGGKVDFKGKLDAVADLKTGVEGIDPAWRAEVSSRTGLAEGRIIEARRGGNFDAAYERGLGAAGRFSGRALGVADALGTATAVYGIARQEADRLNSANPWVGQTESGLNYSTIFDRYYWTFLPISHQENRGVIFWNGPWPGMEIRGMSRERFKELENQLRTDGKTYMDRFGQDRNGNYQDADGTVRQLPAGAEII